MSINQKSNYMSSFPRTPLFYRRTGISITLLTRNDWRVAGELINILERAQQVRLSNLELYLVSLFQCPDNLIDSKYRLTVYQGELMLNML